MGWTEKIKNMLVSRGTGCFYTNDMIQWRNDDGSACRIYGRLDRSGYDLVLTDVPLDRTVEMTLGRGECKIEHRRDGWYCTGCGDLVGSDDPDSELFIDGNAIETWDYCPSCGRVVKR